MINKTQLPQPHLLWKMLQSPQQLCGPAARDLLQYFPGSLVLGSPELHPALLAISVLDISHRFWEMRRNHLLHLVAKLFLLYSPGSRCPSLPWETIVDLCSTHCLGPWDPSLQRCFPAGQSPAYIGACGYSCWRAGLQTSLCWASWCFWCPACLPHFFLTDQGVHRVVFLLLLSFPKQKKPSSRFSPLK